MAPFPDHPRVPAAVESAAETLQRAGQSAWLAGEELARSWWAGPAPGPIAHRLLTSAPLPLALSLFPHAVPTQPSVLMLPGTPEPIDLIVGCDLPGALEDLGFRIHAVAWDVAADRAIDPHSGLADARAELVRTVGDPVETLRRQPVLALRALRIVAEQGFALDAALHAALSEAPLSPTPALRIHGRHELLRTLCGANAGRALALAASSGLARRLAPTADAEAARWIDALPPLPELRLAVWLGPDGAGWLRRWRFGVGRSHRVLDLARHHPIDTTVAPRRDSSVGRLLDKLDARERAALIAAREAQIASGVLSPEAAKRARDGLTALGSAIERVEGNRARESARAELALDGARVMALLACGPGPRVGQALRHLAGIVAADASQNTPEKLQGLLEKWSASN